MRHFFIAGIVLAACVMGSECSGQPLSLDGMYENKGSVRQSTISKMEIKIVKGERRAHLWLYSRPQDTDWGEAVTTEYKNQSNGTTDVVAVFDHDGGKAIVVIRAPRLAGQDSPTLQTQSWISYPHTDERHPNEAAQDILTLKK